MSNVLKNVTLYLFISVIKERCYSKFVDIFSISIKGTKVQKTLSNKLSIKLSKLNFTVLDADSEFFKNLNI